MLNRPSLKDMVAGGAVVFFAYYRDGNLWYQTEVGSLELPVPIADLGNATFLNQDKAMLFMRYIRKHLALLDEAEIVAANG